MRSLFATLCRYAVSASFVALLLAAPSAWSAIAFVQGNWIKSYDSSVPEASLGAQSAGDLNVVIVAASGGVTVTQVSDSAGNAYELAGTSSEYGVVQSVYYAKSIAQASTNTVTATLSSSAIVAYVLVLEYSGLDPVSPLDGFDLASGSGTGASSVTGASVAATSSSSLILGAITTGAGTVSAGSGFTARVDSASSLYGGVLAEDRIVAAAGSYAASATLETDTLWGVQTVIFRGASDTQPPSAPTALTASVASSSQINLSWTASTDNVGVTGYLLERCQGGGCSTFAQVGTPTGTTFNDTGLSASTSYTYRVRARDAVPNVSSYSSTASATTQAALDTLAPSVPTGLTATAVSSTQINLSWSASTDNVGVVGYRVERCQGAGCSSFTQVGSPTGTTFSDTAVAASTSYTYRVRALDAVPNFSGYSATASASTAGAPSGTAGNVTYQYDSFGRLKQVTVTPN